MKPRIRNLVGEWWEVWDRMPEDEWAYVGRYRDKATAKRIAANWSKDFGPQNTRVIHVRRWKLTAS